MELFLILVRQFFIVRMFVKKTAGSLDCPFCIAPSVFSNVYIRHIGVATFCINAPFHIAEGSIHIATGTPLLTLRYGHEGLCVTRMCNTNQKYQML